MQVVEPERHYLTMAEGEGVMGRDEEGGMTREVPAHHLEFAFEIIYSLIIFWFAMDNRVSREA